MRIKFIVIALFLTMFAQTIPTQVAFGQSNSDADYAIVEYNASGDYSTENWTTDNATLQIGGKTHLETVNRYGEYGVRFNLNIPDSEGIMNQYRTDGSLILINVYDRFMKNLWGDNVEVTVKYFDEGTGRFILKYDGRNNDSDGSTNDECETDAIYLENTMTWKEHTFKLYDARFNNTYTKSSADLGITLQSDSIGVPTESVIIQSVTIEKMDSKFPINICENGPIGNIFTQGNKAELSFLATNIESSSLGIDYTLTATDIYGAETTVHGSKVLDPGQNTLVIPTDIDRCGVYDAHIVFKNELENVYGEYDSNFSISVESSKSNESFSVNTHYRIADRNPENSVPLIANMGVRMQRGSTYWSTCEKIKGQVIIPDEVLNGINVGNDNGVKTLFIFSGGNPLYDDGKFPTSDEAIEAFGNYVYQVVSKLKGKVDTFSVWNEIHHTWNNMHPDYATDPISVIYNREYTRQGAKAYVKLLREAYTQAKKANPDCVVGGMGGIPCVWPQWLEEMLDAGAADYLDFIDFHEYTGASCPEESLAGLVKSAMNTIKDKGYENIPVWITETGWTSADTGFLNQAKYTVREYMLFKDMGIDNIMFYDFKNDGTNYKDNENSYGFIFSHKDKAKVPYSAKPIYVAASNMNDKVGEAEIVSHITDSNGTEIFKLENSAGDIIYVLWNIYNTTAVNISIDSEKADVFDLFGNKQTIRSSNGNCTVTVSDEPVYVIKSSDQKVCQISKVDYSKGKITVSVSGVSEGEQVTILVSKPGMTSKDIYTKGFDAICYINQTDKDEDFTFAVQEEGRYGIYMYNGSMLVEMAAECYKKIGAEVSILQSDTPILSFDQIDKNKEIIVNAMVDNTTDQDALGMLFIAFFNNKELSECFAFEEPLENGKKTDITKSVKPSVDYDEISVFLWRDKTRLIPVCNKRVIE